MITITTEQAVDTNIGLKSAILIYGTAAADTYASHHPISYRGDQAIIGSGSSLSTAHLVKAAQDLSPATITDCFIDENVIAFRDGMLGWWRRPQRTRVWFHSATLHNALNQTGEPRPFAVEIPIPGLVFFALGSRLFVYAIKGEGRPGRNTEIYTAPLMNVWDTGQVCTGNVKLPSSNASASISAWERAFFRSRFTHFNGIKKVHYKGGRIALTRDLVNGKFDSFPAKVMMSENIKLTELVELFSNACANGTHGGVDND